MRRALLSLSLVSILALAACGEEEGKAPGGDDAPEQEDTFVVDDDDSTLDPTFDFFDAALLTSAPATLSGTTGGTVTFTVRAAARTEEGEDATLADATADAAVAVTLEDGTELPASLEVLDDQTLAVTVEVEEGFGADLGAENGRQPLTVWIGDAFLAEVPLTRHLDPDTAAQRLMGEGRDVLVPSAETTLCGWTLADMDADGVAEAYTVGWAGDEGVVVGEACRRSTDDPAWVCEDTRLDPGLSEGEDLICGDTDHFRTKDGDLGTVMVAQTTEGRSLQISLPPHDGSGWVGDGSVRENSTLRGFAVVIGMNTTKEDPAVPVDALLALRGGSGGRWGGVYQDGAEPWEWSRIGTLSPSTLGEGKAWAGIFSEHDLSAADDGDAWVWTIDPSKLSGGGKLVVGVSSFSREVSGFVNVRQLEIDPPEFTPELATASGEDLDGDGHPELIVEAWGEGRHAAWIVPGATDKANTRPVTRLTGATGDHETIVAPVRVNGDGGFVQAVPTFKLDGDGRLLSELEELVAEKGLAFGMDVDQYLETPRIQVVQGWDAAEAMADDVSELAPEFAGVVGGGGTWTGTSCVEGRAPTTSGRGVCIRGKCHCLPGYSGRLSGSVGGGSSTTAPGDALAPGDVALLGTDPSGGALVLARLTDGAGEPASWPLLATDDGEGGVSLVEGVFTADGPELREDGVSLGGWDSHSDVAVARTSGGGLGVFIFAPQPIAAAAREEGDPAETLTVEVTLRVRFADQSSGRLTLPTETTTGGSSVPAVLDGRISEEGGVLVGWRDGEGQAWLAVVDVVAAAAAQEGTVPFLQAPVAVGEPLTDPDADGVFGWTTKHFGIVGVGRGIISDTPFFSMEDLEERFSSWDSPMEGTSEDDGSGYGPVVMSVANNGFNETIYIQAFPDIANLSTTTLYSSADPADLPVPRIAATLVPDAPPVVVSTNAVGGVSLDLVDGVRPLAQSWHAFDLEPGAPVSAGDLNGDGIADLIAGQGMDAVVVLSDGTGGELDQGPDPAYFTSFAVLLGGASSSSECALDPEGESFLVRGRALHGAPLIGQR